MENKERYVILSGAGMSADSGLKTFRDAGGLWEGHNVMEVATPEAFARDPLTVHRFYNQRRLQLKEAQPNAGHEALARLEKQKFVQIVTQNVDNLHERGGSLQVLHLHGELMKVRSTKNPDLVLDWEGELGPEDKGPDGASLRPHIVWFGEDVPEMNRAATWVQQADHILIVGTSMQVYPAASLVHFAPPEASITFIDPNPQVPVELMHRIDVRSTTAAKGVPLWVEEQLNK
jgi:NAD-dependent deacetylase